MYACTHVDVCVCICTHTHSSHVHLHAVCIHVTYPWAVLYIHVYGTTRHTSNSTWPEQGRVDYKFAASPDV